MAVFYNSNTGKYEVPAEQGWYIAYKTESGDAGYVKVDREPTSEADAEATLLCMFDYEELFVELYWDYHTPPYQDLMGQMFGEDRGRGF